MEDTVWLYHISEYVKVDAAAIRALDLLPIQKRRSTDAVTPSCCPCSTTAAQDGIENA